MWMPMVYGANCQNELYIDLHFGAKHQKLKEQPQRAFREELIFFVT